MKTIKLALVGCGNVGKAFMKMLELKKSDIQETYGADVIISAICTRSRGSIFSSEGLTLEDFEKRKFDKAVDSFQVVQLADYDVLVELTQINIQTGQPAIDHIRGALSRKKHVITANKGPEAWAYRELRDLAAKNGVCYLHESAVMDGVPVFNLQRETLRGCKITEIRGILNATTNYILNELEQGVSFDEAVAEGQRRGFVEADPSMDIEGWDAAAKLTVLMNVLMDVKITPMEIQRTGIRSITKEQLDEAGKKGGRIKLICHGRVENGKPVGTVAPQLIGTDDIFSSINGTAAAVTLRTDLMGEVSIIEHVYQPEIDQTAYGVLGDLLRIISAAKPSEK